MFGGREKDNDKMKDKYLLENNTYGSI